MLDTLDIWIFPVRIGPTNDTLVFYENGSDIVVTLDHGLYWALGPNGYEDYPSLVGHITDKINSHSSTSNTYRFVTGSPDYSYGTDLSYWGITLERLTGSYNYGWAWGHGSRNFDAAYLGYRDSYSGTDQTGSAFLEAPKTRKGVWMSPRPGVKTSDWERDARTNNAPHRLAQVADYGIKDLRGFRYNRIFAGHIRANCNQDGEYAQVAGLPDNEEGNYFSDLWKQGISTYQDIIVVNNATSAYYGWSVPDSLVDVVMAAKGSSYAQKFSDCARPSQSKAGEVYNIEMTLVKIGGDYNG